MSRVRLPLIVQGVASAMPAFALAAVLAAAPAFASTELSGTWRSAPEELPLATEFDESVWGKNATSVRTVDMAVRPDGEATLTITRKVVDARGRTVNGSLSVEEARVQVGGVAEGTPPVPERVNLAVTVVAAERRYPDDPESRWPIDGLRVGVTRFTDDPNVIEVRVDTPEGRGSFWETLRRSSARTRTAKPSTP
jgi:hypothetical protein